MRFICLKTNVKGFCIHKTQLILVNEENEVVLENNVLLKSDYTLQEIYSNNSIVYTNTSNGTGIIIENNIVKRFNESIIKKVSQDTLILSRTDGTYFYSNTKLVSKLNAKLFKFHFKRSSQTLLYFSKKTCNIINFNIENGIEQANFKLSLLGVFLDGTDERPLQVIEFSGVYKNTLVCTLNNGGILLLDINEGKVIEYFSDAQISHNLHQKEEGSSIFFGLNHDTFIEIDVAQNKIIKKIILGEQLKKLKDIPDESLNWVFINTSIIANNLLYFRAYKDIIGVFDPEKEQIIDYYDFDIEKSKTMLKIGKENFRVNDNKIYCLDTANILHIFEKE